MNASKYMAAAQGGRNVASSGHLSADVPIPTPSSRPIGNMAGFHGGNSAWIQNIDSGYGRRPQRAALNGGSQVRHYTPRKSSMIMSIDYTTPKYHGVLADRDLSKSF